MTKNQLYEKNKLNTKEIVDFIVIHKDSLIQRFGIISIGIFGSYAREKESNKSDIDILVEFKEPKYDYWAGLKIFLEESLKLKVDLITNGNYLSKKFLNRIKKDIIYV